MKHVLRRHDLGDDVDELSVGRHLGRRAGFDFFCRAAFLCL
jgi:hypothetical protein